MCRLLAYAADHPTTLATLLGTDDLAEFTALSQLHGDGWGIAGAGTDTVSIAKASDAAHSSARFAHAAGDLAYDLALVHLRWATLGLPVLPVNAHPFTDGRLAFAHNGSIVPTDRLEPLIDEGLRHLAIGTTDSEKFFLAVLTHLARSGGTTHDDDAVAASYAATVTAVQTTLAPTSLNSVLITPTRLMVAAAHDPLRWENDDPTYYHLGYRQQAGAVVVASSGWGRGWTPLPSGHLLSVQRGSLRTTVVALPLGPWAGVADSLTA